MSRVTDKAKHLSNPTGTHGSSSQVPVITVTADGRISSISNTAVAGVSSVTFTVANNNLRISTSDGTTHDVTIQTSDKMSVANTQALYTTLVGNSATWSALTSTNTAIRTLVADRMQVANVNSINTTLTAAVNDRMQVANTTTLVNDRMQVANTQALYTALQGNSATWSALTGTNTAIRTLVSDRLQVANAAATYLPLTGGTLSSDLTVGGSLQVDGDLQVTGNTITVGTTNLSVSNNFIYINDGGGNSNIDMGWAGGYNDGTYAHAGVFRDATDGKFKIFDSYTPEVSAAVDINTSHASYDHADLQMGSLYVDDNLYIGGTQVTSTAAELNKLDGYTGSVTELNYLKSLYDTDVTSTEFDYLDGVTSNIQTQLNTKLASSSYTAADVLTKIKTVDGSGSGLDADTLDGVEGANYLRSDASDQTTGDLTIAQTTPSLTLNDTDGVLGGSINALLYYKANGSDHGYVGFSTSGGIMSLTNTNGNVYINADNDDAQSSSQIQLRVDGAEKMRITSDGNVGIGTDSPAEKLDVNGAVIYNQLHPLQGGNHSSATSNVFKLGTIYLSGSQSAEIIVYGTNSYSAGGNIVGKSTILLRGSNSTATLEGMFTGISSGNPPTVQQVYWKQTGTDSTFDIWIKAVGTYAGFEHTVTTSGNWTPGYSNTGSDSQPTGSTAITETNYWWWKNTPRMGFTSSEINFNDGGDDIDFRVESDTNQYALVVQGSDGNVGIGTGTPQHHLTVYGNSATASGQYGSPATLALTNEHGAAGVGGTIIFAADTPAGGAQFYGASIRYNNKNSSTDGSIGNLEFLTKTNKTDTTLSTRMTILPGGNVGIGTDSPEGTLHLHKDKDVSGAAIIVSVDDTYKREIIFDEEPDSYSLGHYGFQIGYDAQPNDFYITSTDAGTSYTHLTMERGTGVTIFGSDIEALAVQNTEYGVTINGGGNGRIYATATSHHDFNRTAAGEAFRFRVATNVVGSIDTQTSGTTYNTTSDRRLKENIKPIKGAKNKLLSMKPCTFTFKADEDKKLTHGFIAQEMKPIMPEAVNGDPGDVEMMSMDYGRITPVIVAALQDALKEIEELKTRINELENK